MKAKKVVLPLLICLSLILTTFNPVFAKSSYDNDTEVLNVDAISESMQEDYGVRLMAEASGVDEKLPSWSTNPTWEPINSDLNNESRYTVLMKILESTDIGDRYVRLNTDISVSGDYGYIIAVKGNKVLDLNGHKLSIKLGKGEGYSGNQSPIIIDSGATLMVIDSKGGGKIFGDTWICDPVDLGYQRASTDLFYNKGTLIIHMPNGEIETGRSKKQWVTAAAEDGEYQDIAYARYSGYIRGQANGTAIIGTKNSTTVLVSGRVIGRGFYKFGTNAWSHDNPSEKCSAIETKGKFIMYGGEVFGLGGADALRAYGGKNNTIVYSGNFCVKSLDKMAIAAYKAYTPRPNFTEKCGYGYPISGERNFAIGSEIIMGDHEVTIRPKSETETTSDTLSFTHSYGTSIIDLEKQDMWVVYAHYTPYFSQPARNYLGYSKNPTGYDYNVPTFWKATAKFTVLDHYGKEIGYYNEPSWRQDDDDGKSLFRCDVLACKDKKGNPIAWEERLTYTLRCTITESWGGDPEQTRVVYQDLNFRFWDSETRQVAKNLSFDFIPTKTAKGEPTNYIIALNDSYVNDVKNSRISEMTVDYSYYEPKKNNKGEITGFEKKSGGTLVYEESLLDNDGTNYFPSKKVVLKPKAAGPIEVSIDLFTASGVKIETKTYKILAMPALTARFLSSEEYAVPEDGYTMTPQYQTWKVSMNAGADTFKNMTDYSILPSAVKWQYYDWNTSTFVDISSSDTRFVIEDGGNVLATNRTGEYRASYTFEGVRYYSPRTIFMNGTNFSNTRAPYISGPSVAEYGDNTKLTVKLNDNADWPAVSEYTLICRGQPSGARVGSSSVSNTTGIFDIETSFFRLMKDNFVPGNYTFEAKVRHADGVATSRRFVLTYEKTNTNYVFLVNGEQAEFNDVTGESRYTLPTDSNGIFNVEYGLYPSNSTKLKYPEKDYNYSIKNLTPEIITFANGTAAVLSPGDAKLNLEISKKTDGSIAQTVPLTVTAPIVGFEVAQPDYNAYLGKKWEDVRADVKSVWGPGERKVTADANKYLTVSTKSLNGVGLYDTVDYNGKADITWKAQPNTGYRFAMKIVSGGYGTDGKKSYTMCADVYSIRTNNFTDTVKTAIEHNIYESNSSGDFYYYTEGEADGDDTRNPTNAKIYLTSKNAHVKDPNVQYIDVVSVTTSNPAVGDLRYEGTDPEKYYHEFVNVEIGTLSGVLNTDGNPIITAQTHVSKLDTVKGSGKPYDNAQDEDMGDYWKITNIVNGVANKPTQRYETGIHKNWLRLETSGTDSSGTKYLFAPEMKLFVNGHLIEYAYVSYDKYMSASSRLDVFYYFDVGEVAQHASATVDMTGVTPIVGEKPKGIDEVFALNTSDVEVTKLLWFVDENGNGKYDLGEEADSENGNLSADGKFLPDKKYSVNIEVGLADGAAGRLSYPFTLNVKYDDSLGTVQQTKQQTVSSLEPSGVFTFPASYITHIDETADAPADGSYNKYFAPINITAEEMPLKGYKLSSYFFKNLDGTNITEEHELTPGKQYWYVVSFAYAYDESRFSPPLATVSVDGVPLVKGESDTHSWYEVYSNIVTIHYLYTVPGGGSASDVTVNAIGIDATKYSVSGQTVTVTHDKACKVGYLDGEAYKAVSATKIEDGKYSFTVPDGVKEVILVVKGDANGDGNVNSADAVLIKRSVLSSSHPAYYAAKKTEAFAADVNGDGNVNSADTVLVKRSILSVSHTAYKALEF